jgi:zinc finger homeobox protein 1/2
VPLPAAGVGKAVSPGSGADDGGGAGATGIGNDYFIKCPQCHKGYPGFQALKEHVESSHPPTPHVGGGDDGVSQPTSPVGSPAPNTPGGAYACSQCNTSFLHKDQLEKHELLHSPNAQVVSTPCSL